MQATATLSRRKEPRWFLASDLDFILHCCGDADRQQFFDECRQAIREGRAVQIGSEIGGRRHIERSLYTMTNVAELEAEAVHAMHWRPGSPENFPPRVRGGI